MDVLDLEVEILKLPVVERARLAEALLKSLESLSEEEHQRVWTDEAARRDAELDADPEEGATRGGRLPRRASSPRMTLEVVFHDLAEEELNEAAAYYAHARPGLGEAFLAEVQRAVDALVTVPLAGTLVDKHVRWWLLKRFPYSILYRVHDDHIRVLAIAHHKRRPFYWRGRQ